MIKNRGWKQPDWIAWCRTCSWGSIKPASCLSMYNIYIYDIVTPKKLKGQFTNVLEFYQILSWLGVYYYIYIHNTAIYPCNYTYNQTYIYMYIYMYIYIHICIYIYIYVYIYMYVYMYVNMDGRGYNIKTNCFQLLGVSKTELYTNRIGDIMRYITWI